MIPEDHPPPLSVDLSLTVWSCCMQTPCACVSMYVQRHVGTSVKCEFYKHTGLSKLQGALSSISCLLHKTHPNHQGVIFSQQLAFVSSCTYYFPTPSATYITPCIHPGPRQLPVIVNRYSIRMQGSEYMRVRAVNVLIKAAIV